MKKRLLVGFIALLILGILGTFPYLAGLIAKNKLIDFIESTHLPAGVSIKLDDYTVRYTRSWAQIKVKLDEPVVHQPHTSYVRLKLFHGPIFPDQDDKLSIGLARIAVYAKAADLAPADARLQDSLENFFEKNEILEGNAVIGLMGSIAAHFATAPAYYKSGEGSLSFEGITGAFTMSGNLSKMSFNMDASPLLLEGKNGSIIDMAAVKVRSEGRRQHHSPWVGKQSVSLSSFYLKDEVGQIIRFNEFVLNTESNIKDKFSNIILDISANEIDFFNEPLGNASFKLALERLDPEGLVEFSELTQSNPEHLEGSAWHAARRKALVDIFKKGAILSLTQTLTPPAGDVMAQANVTFSDLDSPDAELDMLTQQLLLKMKASVSMHAPLVWLENVLYHVALPYLPPDAPPVIDPQTKKTMPAADVLRLDIVRQFEALNQAHILVTEQGNSHIDLRYDAGNLFLNDKPLTQEDIVKLMLILDSY